MKIKDAIDWIDIARMGYICDPNECGLEKDGDPCRAFHCDEIHDALVMAIEALEIADRLEQADEKKMARRMICDTCSEAETCGQGELGDWCCEYDVILKTIEITLAAIIGEENGK